MRSRPRWPKGEEEVKRIAVFLTIFFTTSFSLAKQTDKEIIRRSDQLIRGTTNKGNLEMTIKTPYFERTLKMKMWNKGLKKTFVRITSPAKEAGTGTLKIGNEMWNYLPSIEKIIKVPPSMMMSSWMGSDFTNDDIVKESSIVEDYDHKILGEEKVDGYDAYKVEALPKPNAPVVWGKVYYWSRKRDAVPLRNEFYDEKGTLIKVLEFKEIKAMGGRVIPTLMVMKSTGKENSQTTLKLSEMQFEITIPDSVFSLRNLQSGK